MNKQKFLKTITPLEPKLFGYAFRMLRSEEATRDAMQELFMKLWNKRKELNQNQNIAAYCFRALRNICIDALRVSNRYQGAGSGERGTGSRELGERLSHPGPDPGSAVSTQNMIEHIRTAIDQLPEKQRAVIELHDFQQMTYPEIAEILEMEVNAVRVNLSRARAKIQSQFRKEEIYE